MGEDARDLRRTMTQRTGDGELRGCRRWKFEVEMCLRQGVGTEDEGREGRMEMSMPGRRA